MKKLFLCLLCGMLVIGVTGCGNQENEELQKVLLGTWSGESSKNQMCEWTFKEENVTRECYGTFNKVYDFTGTYKVIDEDTVIIMSDESGNKNEYEYKIKEEEGLSPKQLTLIPVEGATTSTKYENFWLED